MMASRNRLQYFSYSNDPFIVGCSVGWQAHRKRFALSYLTNMFVHILLFLGIRLQYLLVLPINGQVMRNLSCSLPEQEVNPGVEIFDFFRWCPSQR